jgi:hypothetical protein
VAERPHLMEDYAGSQAQGAVLFSDSADWEAHAGPVDVKMCRMSFIPAHVEVSCFMHPASISEPHPARTRQQLKTAHSRQNRLRVTLPQSVARDRRVLSQPLSCR